jgi:hypothetical protein
MDTPGHSRSTFDGLSNGVQLLSNINHEIGGVALTHSDLPFAARPFPYVIVS